MPPRKKNSPSAAQDPDTLNSPPIVIETHSVNRRWKEEKTLEEIAPDDLDDLDDLDDPKENVITPPPDPIQDIVDSMDGGLYTWGLTVSRLKNYAKDGRRDPASRTHCGTLAIPDSEYLKGEQYIDEIQEKFARGNDTNFFLLAIRRNGSNYKLLPTILALDPLPESALIKNGRLPGNNNYFPQPAPPDPVDGFLAVAEKFHKLQRLMGINPANQQQNNANAAPMTAELALVTALNADNQLIDGFIEKARRAINTRSDGGHETTMMDLALEAIKTDLPGKIIAGIRDLIIEARNGALAGPPGAVNMPPAPIPGAPHQTPPMAQNNNGIAPSTLPPEAILLNFTLQACANPKEWPPEKAAQWIIQFEEINPPVSPLIDGFRSMLPHEALQFLIGQFPQAAPVAQLPHALDWVARLQAELQPEEENNETPPPAPTEE